MLILKRKERGEGRERKGCEGKRSKGWEEKGNDGKGRDRKGKEGVGSGGKGRGVVERERERKEGIRIFLKKETETLYGPLTAFSQFPWSHQIYNKIKMQSILT
jgi:hypothetical protein